MSEMPEFERFDSIPRLTRECVITEKIDGTNATVAVLEDDRVIAGSRSRWLLDGQDNFGFAAWVREHEEELRTGLGRGIHRGEWWGSGIQRNYGLVDGEKRFSLFNTHLWSETRPECCSVVPVLWQGEFDTTRCDAALRRLELEGSIAAPGFMKPEGIVVYHIKAGQYFKKTTPNDGHKGKV